MIKYLLKWPYLRQIVLKELMNEVNSNKPKDKVKTEFTFIDPTGMRYYQYQNLWDMPICRKQKLEILAKEHQEKLSFYDVKLFIEAGEKILEEGEKVVPRIGYWLGVMKDKTEKLFHPYTMLEMAACLLIREDQDPSIWDDELEARKIEDFKKWSRQGEGLHAFFMQSGLGIYFPFLESMGKDFDKYSMHMESIQKTFENMMMKY